MALSRTQRNELVSVLASKGLDPSEFPIDDSSYSFTIQSPEKHVKFYIRYEEGNLFKPSSSPEGFVKKNFWGYYPWQSVVDAFDKWAEYAAKELQTPDLWAQVKAGPSFLTNDTAISNEHFSPSEISALENKVQTVEEHIGAINLPADAQSAFTEIARDIPKDAAVLSKKKLGELLTGQLISQGIKWALTTEHMHAVWNAFRTFIQLLLH